METHDEANETGEGAALPQLLAMVSGAVQGAALAQGATQTALLAGTHWGAASGGAGAAATVISFSFAGAASTFCDAYAGSGFTGSVREFRAEDKQAVRQTLAAIEAVCNVRFVEVDDSAGGGTLRYAYSQTPNDMGFGGYAFFPSSSAQGGDVWLGQNQSRAEWDFYRPYLILHETLHALGLKHPFSGADTLAASADMIPNTVMSYSAIAGYSSGALSRYPSEPMPLDVQALQALYGTAENNSGNTRYDLSLERWSDGFHVIWDSGGTDLLDASGCADGVTLDLRPGAHSDLGGMVYAFAQTGSGLVRSAYTYTLAIAQGSMIENAVGSAQADTLIGNSGANVLLGGGGNDLLAGLGGGDVLDGGEGTDTVVYAGNRADYELVRQDTGYTVRHTGAGAADRLAHVERVAFRDVSVALDLDGHAGQAAKLVGALLGRAAVSSGVPVGIALALFDGGMDDTEVATQLVRAVLGDSPAADTALVNLVWRNLVGGAPQADVSAYWVGLLQSGAVGRGSLALLAADSDANKLNIDLVGLAQGGLAFVPDYA
ncbi:MAG: M10 family metallopeptidase C-terminal domain-containing protein [Burkholderiales bacterium]|nr:M10 family metallopeptidase C-terminal domain-containing protein [Burkholderiales bacterium]